MTKYHATKTFRGQSACAGSGTTDITKTQGGYGNLCPTCKRTNIGRVHGTGRLSTHLHEDDLARPEVKAVPVYTPRPKRVFTPEQIAAITAFYADENQDTWNAMHACGANDTSEYVRYAMEQGWEK